MGSDTPSNSSATENHASSNGNVDKIQGMYRITCVKMWQVQFRIVWNDSEKSVVSYVVFVFKLMPIWIMDHTFVPISSNCRDTTEIELFQ